MKTSRLPRIRRYEFLLLGFVTACGGGGGSSSPPLAGPPSIQEPPAPTVNYTGSRQSLVLTQSNVSHLAYTAFTLRSLVQDVELLWVDAPQGPIDDQSTISGQLGGQVTLRAQTDSNGRGYLEADFQDYSDDPDITVNGRLLQRFRPESGEPGNIDFSFAGPGTLEFDDLTVSVGGASLTYLGVLRITGVDSDAFHVNVIVSESAGGTSVYFENCTLQFSEAQVGSSIRPAVDIAGAIYERSEGGFEFSSLGPIPDLGFNESAGYIVGGAGGGIEMIADGPTTHVRSISFAFASIIMDMDGDGSPETAKRYSWPGLAGEPVVETSVMQGPIANAGNRRSPAASAPVKMHGLFSHDDDGDWLTFAWQLLARPPLSTVSADDVAARPYFEFSPDVAGDYVWQLRVSDGASASKTAVVIRHAPSDADDADDEPAGGLEVGQPPATVSTPILIDAKSSMNWPYEPSNAFWFRTGFGNSVFDDTGDPASTYLTVANEGLNGIRFSHDSPFAGAPNSHAEISLAVGPGVFETAIDLPGDANAFDVHKLDFDGDGDHDLALRAGVGGAERIVIFLATPDGLEPGPDVPAGRGEIAHNDMNGDGLADLLSAADEGLLLFMQAPDHSLAAPQLLEYPASGCDLSEGTTDIALDNVDASGRADVIAVHPCRDAIVSWLQQTAGGFGAASTIAFENHRILGAAFGDVNSDGRTDVLATLSGVSTDYEDGVSILVSQPNGMLAEQYFVKRTGIGGMGSTIGDIDNDGRADAVIVNIDEVILYRQQPDSTLVPSVIYSDPGSSPFEPAISLVDLDDDGHRDIFFCNSEPIKQLLLQQPGGAFQHVRGPQCLHMDLVQPEIAASVDLNGDGSIELVTATDEARGSVGELVLLKVYLQGIQAYPVPD